MTAQKKKSNIIIVVVLLLIVITVTIYLNRSRSNNNSLLAGLIPSNNLLTPGQEEIIEIEDPSSVEVTDYTILSLGARGPQVSKLQKLINVGLNLLGRSKITVDGQFGPKTEAAILYATGSKRISYQSAYTRLKSVLAGRGINLNDYL